MDKAKIQHYGDELYQALVSRTPDLAGWQGVHDWLNGELAKLG